MDKWRIEIREPVNDLKENVNSKIFFTQFKSRRHLRKFGSSGLSVKEKHLEKERTVQQNQTVYFQQS